MTWPFAEPATTEVITLGRILRGESPLLLITHDEEDGEWQFLDGEQVFEDDAVVICLGEMVQFDPSVSEVADLPTGSYAWRSNLNEPWMQARGDSPILPSRDAI